MQCYKTGNDKKTTQPDGEPTHQDQTNRDQPPPYQRATTKKKTTGAGHDLGEEEHGDERVEGEVHVRDEETQGESQTPEKGFGFPQRLRKKERERERERRRRSQPNNQRKRRGQQTPKRTRGQVLKGTKTSIIPTPETKPRTKQPKNIPEQPNNETSTNPTSLGGLHTAGWRGPWAALHLLRRHPRGPWYRGVRGPPHHGNRPRWRKNKHHVRQVTCTPESWARLLAGPYRLKRPLSQSIQEANSTAIINRTDS